MCQPTRSIALAFCLSLHAVASIAAEYHVDPSGNDLDPGTAASPWATLQYAADSVTPGDTVNIHAGTYTGFHLTTSGTSTNSITFSAESGVVIDQPNSVTGDGINLEGASFVVVEGFTVQGASAGLIRNGLRAVLAEHVTFRNNATFDNAERGIFTGFVDDVLIEHNEVGESIDEHGIYVSNSGDRPVIRDNYLHDNNAAGIHINGDASAGGDGVISGALVERNVIVNNGDDGGGAGVNADGVQDSVIRNNLIIGGHASGITLFQTDGGAPSKRNLVMNNTVVNDSDGRWAITVRDASTDNTLVNNIFLSRHGFRGAIDVHSDSLPGLVSDYNVVEDRFTTDSGDSTLTLAQWRAQTGQDLNSFVAAETELFVEPTLPDGDFHLKAGSPALDVGLQPVDAERDFEGGFRRSAASVDIGADERDICIGESVLEIDNAEVTSDETHTACRIFAGPALEVKSAAKLTTHAADRVILRAGFRVETGARLSINPP